MFRCESLKNGHYSYWEMRMAQMQFVPQRRKTQHDAICVTGKAVGVVWGTMLLLAQVLGLYSTSHL